MGALLSSAVVGRTAELTALRLALDRAVEGRGTTVVVTGEPGIGKSRLLREVRRWCLARGSAVLAGRAVDTAVAAPFRPLTEALLAAYRAGPVLDDPEVAPFRTALARLVPDGTVRVAAVESSAGPLLHVAEGFLRVARARARARSDGGAAVLLDDLHWADAETLAVVEYLADNVGDEPVLLVLAARHDPSRAAVRSLLALADRRAASLLRVTRLTEQRAVEMTRGCLGDAAVPAQVLRLVADQADGLPFFVEELLAGLEHDGALVREGDRWTSTSSGRGRPPTTFVESVRQRVASLPPSGRRVLHDAALLGRRRAPGGVPGSWLRADRRRSRPPR